jgi:hypothetical protein
MLDFIILYSVMIAALFVTFAIIWSSFTIMEKEYLDRS